MCLWWMRESGSFSSDENLWNDCKGLTWNRSRITLSWWRRYTNFVEYFRFIHNNIGIGIIPFIFRRTSMFYESWHYYYQIDIREPWMEEYNANYPMYKIVIMPIIENCHHLAWTQKKYMMYELFLFISMQCYAEDPNKLLWSNSRQRPGTTSHAHWIRAARIAMHQSKNH